MTDTLYADVSEFQYDANNTYPHRFIAFRSNDGTYQDQHFAANIAWAKTACDSGRLVGFCVYFVWEPNWQATVATFKAMVGAPHPRMAVMIDVESWGGRIRGDQSAGINAARENVIGWLGGARSRVIGYANAGDFAALWPNRGDARVVVANYSTNPPFPGKIAHQFSSTYPVPPFGLCDANSADGYTPEAFAAVLGLTPPIPAPVVVPASLEDDVAYLVIVDQAECEAKKVRWPGIFLTNGSSLTHVEPHTATADNLAAWKKLGVPGPETITLAQYHSLGGK